MRSKKFSQSTAGCRKVSALQATMRSATNGWCVSQKQWAKTWGRSFKRGECQFPPRLGTPFETSLRGTLRRLPNNAALVSKSEGIWMDLGDLHRDRAREHDPDI